VFISLAEPQFTEAIRMKHGARNDIVGEIVEMKMGDVMAQAKVKMNGEFNLSSVMTADSLKALGVKEGDKVRVLIKAVNVLLIKDE
jgi:molybdopterin-binding protein